MFEPRATCECSEAQAELMEALERRDLASFRELLTRNDVDPDHWYGRPYKGTCLMIACSVPGGEPFAVELVKAGASRHYFPRNSTLSAPRASALSVNSHNGAHGTLDRNMASPDQHHRVFSFDTEQILHQRLRTLSAELDNVRYQNDRILHEQENLEHLQTSLKESLERAIVGNKEQLEKNGTHFDAFQQKLNDSVELLKKVEKIEKQNNILLTQILETLKKNTHE